MAMNRLLGFVLLVVGGVLLAFAYHASNAPVDQVTNADASGAPANRLGLGRDLACGETVMMRPLLVLALPALLATATVAHAETAPAAPDPASAPAPAAAPAAPIGERFIVVAVGAAAGAMMPQLAVVDGLVLMSAIMGGMIADMAYNSARGMPPK